MDLLMMMSMASIIGSISNYVKTFDPKEFKNKLINYGSSFFTFYTYPNEHLHKAILRIACEALAGVMIAFAMVTGGIPLAIGFIAYRLFEPTNHFIIQNKGGPLTNEQLQIHLKKLLNIQKQFNCIEIRSTTPLLLNNENTKFLKQINPNKLILPILNLGTVLDQLEAFTFFYQNDTASNLEKSIYHLVRKQKINHLVLPTNPEEMINILTQLSEKNERINKLSFTSIVPKIHELQVGALLTKLKPTIKIFINNQENYSAKTLEAIMQS